MKNIIINSDFKVRKLEYSDIWLYLMLTDIIDKSSTYYYHEKIKLKKIINEQPIEILNNLYFPCHECLVNAACTEHCTKVFKL